MKKSTFAIFTGYIWTKLLVHLLTKPYSSMREVSRRTVLLPVVFSPMYSIVILFLIGRLGTLLFELHGPWRDLVAFLLSTGLIAILLWQSILIYFLIVFFFAKAQK